jgi:hypothetical protein
MRPLERVLGVLEVARGPDAGGEHWAFCPAHDDCHTPNLHVREAEDGSVLLRCFAGCNQDEVLSALQERGISRRDLFSRNGSVVEGGELPPKPRATLQPHPEKPEETGRRALHGSVQPAATVQPSCTLEAYAEAKALPVELLREFGLSTLGYMGGKAVRMPYLKEDGTEGAVRLRLALEKSPQRDNRFRWRKGSKPTLYGLWRMERVREAGYVVLVEGESDCHTLWHHDIEALGVPGAANWKEEWAAHLAGIEKIYAIVEPDEGGTSFEERLSASAIRNRLYLVRLDDAKDASNLHLRDPDRFKENLRAAFKRARRWTDAAREETEIRIREAWEQCKELARERRILDRFASELGRSGLAGETRAAKLLYLALTSRLLEKIASVAVKGPSSGGKTYLVERVLLFFPESAYYALTAMSERTLAYSEEPIRHRFLVIYEAEGMSGDFATYLMRSLLSEGRVRYETVESTKDGIKPRLIEREGPTGLIVTTTAVRLHPENETRMLSLTVTDTQDQTKNVLKALAKGRTEKTDLTPWLALQEWLESAEHRVAIPYAEALAELVPPVAVRLRRDFGAVLNLIRSHAVLHQASRERDTDGHIIASLDDYEAVRELVEDLVSEGIDATVSQTVREAVGAVSRLREDAEGEPVSIAAVAKELGLDKSAASRRIRNATEQGYLKNLEDRRGKPARLVPGDPLPEDLRILPATEELRRCTTDATQQLNGADGEKRIEKPLPPDRCNVAGENGGRDTPLHAPDEDGRVRFTL